MERKRKAPAKKAKEKQKPDPFIEGIMAGGPPPELAELTPGQKILALEFNNRLLAETLKDALQELNIQNRRLRILEAAVRPPQELKQIVPQVHLVIGGDDEEESIQGVYSDKGTADFVCAHSRFPQKRVMEFPLDPIVRDNNVFPWRVELGFDEETKAAKIFDCSLISSVEHLVNFNEDVCKGRSYPRDENGVLNSLAGRDALFVDCWAPSNVGAISQAMTRATKFLAEFGWPFS